MNKIFVKIVCIKVLKTGSVPDQPRTGYCTENIPAVVEEPSTSISLRSLALDVHLYFKYQFELRIEVWNVLCDS